MTAAADFGAATEVAEADETSPVAGDATQARRQVVVDRVVAADAGMKRASAARLAPCPDRQGRCADAAGCARPPRRRSSWPISTVAQAAVPRSPDVASLEADVASAALEQASRLATTSADLGFAPANAPRSPDVTSLEADATTRQRSSCANQLNAASSLDRRAAELDRR